MPQRDMTSLVRRSRPRRRGYSDVPHGLWTLVELSAAARLILGWLHSHDTAYLQSITVNRIRREFGTSSVPKYLAEMEDAGFIEVERKGNGQASSIVLLMDPWEELFTAPPQAGEPRRDRPGSSDDNRAEIGSVPRRDRLGDRAETGAPTAPRSARVEDQGEEQREDQGEPASPAAIAREITQAYWDWVKGQTGKSPVGIKFVAMMKLVEDFVAAGYESRMIKHAMAEMYEQKRTFTRQVFEQHLDGRAGQRAQPNRTLSVAQRQFEKYQAEEAAS